MSYKRTSPQPVVEGGTGTKTMTTAYAPVCAGTTATGPLQVASTGISTPGFALVSNGASALPSFQDISTTLPLLGINGDTGALITQPIDTITGGTSGAVFTASGSTITESFNFLALPTTSTTVGFVTLNGNRFMHAIGSGSFLGTNAGNLSVSGGIGIGFQAAGTIVTAFNSVAIGTNSLKVANNSSNDVAIGRNAGTALTTTSAGNVFIGNNACSDAGTGLTNNIAIGQNAMTGSAKTSAIRNICIGTSSGTGITTGNRNLFLGASSGQGVTTGNENISFNGGNVGNVSNQLIIGLGTGTSAGQLNASFIHGIRGITTVNANAIAVLIDSAGQLGTVSSSQKYKENISDMGDISSSMLNLRPVTFDFISSPSHKKQVGLIAEEVQQVMPDLVAHNINGEVESVKYQDLSALLLNELQKVLQRIEFLEKRLN